MNEALEEAKEELKRVDHLIFVSLKYTRTCDVLLNVVKRLVDSYEYAVEALVLNAQSKGIITEDVPPQILAKIDLLLKKYDDQTIKNNIETYLLFRKILKAKYEKINEYRRHVTLKTKIDGKDIEIHIDNLTDYYNIIKEFLDYIQTLIKG